MRVSHKIIGIALAIGLASWVVDAGIDASLFGQGTFWDTLAPVSGHHLYMRLLTVSCVLICYSRYLLTLVCWVIHQVLSVF